MYFLRAESYFNLVTEIDSFDKELGGRPILAAYGDVSLHAQSHGDSFMALLMSRLRPGGLYFMDEPEAAWSPNRQLAALYRIHDLAARDAQFVIVTHSPNFMECPGA